MKKILIADGSEKFLEALASDPLAKRYQIETARSGPECLEKMAALQPDLLLIDLMLPEMHGIEILKRIKSDPKTRHWGVFIASAEPMIQNYHAALTEGAAYFLKKPLDAKHFFLLVEQFFSGKLHPDPFSGQESEAIEGGHCYLPKAHPPDCYIKFWGTRGSNPVSGPEYVRFGGNTCCLEIRYGKDRILIDAGTGIRPLGKLLLQEEDRNIHLFLGHTHWDHVTGFPFFNPIYRPDTHIDIWSPIGYEKSTHDLFTDMLAYAYFPVRLDDIQARITFKDLRDGGVVQIGKIRVDMHYAYHPGPTLCFKIHVAGKTIGYATDNEVLLGYHGDPHALKADDPLLTPHQSQIAFFKGCDFLIHEAQYTPIEYQKKVGWGHSSISNAAVLVKYCGVKEWIVTHHDPSHTDEDLFKKIQLHNDILSAGDIHCHVRMAFDGLSLPL
jgi:CheY-like chemotaxis protein